MCGWKISKDIHVGITALLQIKTLHVDMAHIRFMTTSRALYVFIITLAIFSMPSLLWSTVVLHI